ncbi:MAG: sigma 54-interacting transcriptional regulator [Candidatus Krumholzibacteriia bacterium]|nr:sigma-54-dependent Fis family transcriptional regulator [bacterium]MCB9513553.1 sigma-54-dependent Fis family transcriptional regulator [Candidatus Latescibacterota bacterium]MCB9515599.1 sigma-54-dependent Fis family transcriptional regulator [Candidatus Latescibacterota bacterium]
MTMVNASVLLLDPNGVLIMRWAEALAGDYQVESARSAEDALAQLGEWLPDYLVLHLEPRNAVPLLDGLERLLLLNPELPVVLALDDGLPPEQRLRALRQPIYAHLASDCRLEELRIVLDRARDHSRRQQERLLLRQQRLDLDVYEMGGSLGALHEEIQQAAGTELGVLVYGNQGSGRREVAKKLHLLSKRAREPFVSFNPAGLSVEDCRVRLFGRESRDGLRRRGLLEIADGGTLLLEGVERLPRSVQAELYRALHEKRCTRVGGIHPVSLNVRPMATACRSLTDAAREGEFHGELFSLLHVYSLAVPSLDERREDIPALVRGYLRRYGRRHGRPELELDPAVEAFLMRRNWPGSLHELRRSVELAVLRAEGRTVTLADFGVNGLDVELLPLSYRKAKKLTEMDFKRRFFSRLLRLAEGKVTAAAQMADVPRPSLSTMIKEAGLAAESFKPARATRKAAAR